MKKYLYRVLFGFCSIILFSQLNVNAQDALDIKRIEQAVDKYLTYFSNDNPGAVISVINKGEIIFNKAYGLSNIQEKEIMTVNQIFNLEELSKSFTALAILKLVEKNRLSLDDNLIDILPDFPEYGNNIKIRNLLNHTSGLKSYDEQNFSSNEQVLEFLKKQNESNFPPGSKWKSSNSDYALLGKIIEEASKMSYRDFLSKHIFDKLSMNNTFLAEDINKITSLAYGHFKEGDEYIVKNEVNKIYGEQGIYMNIEDFVKWDLALYSDKLIKCESLNKIFTVSKLNNGKNTPYYGFGWILMEKNGVKYYWHGGSGNGYSNLIFHLPDTQMTILILTNRNDGYDFLRLAIIISKQFNRDLKL
ncbi:MAG: beta-lactamase family protein [Bacteroidales bacterium]|nr:beta-lactamase family protein [Bacteroidales bacterium]